MKAPLYMDQLYYEFFLGFVRPSDFPNGRALPSGHTCKGDGIDYDCLACEREYAAMAPDDDDLECPRCGELDCVCDDIEDDYDDDEEWEDEHL